MSELSPKKRHRSRDDASEHVRSLLEKNIDANVRGQSVEKHDRSWTRSRWQGRILWIKKLTR
ncbi:MAG: hypothetical protein AUH85_11455 [Chloroflexi bacterium 13_1_40CM_4_68_4]|nr:MAG: hypothetical protein AUH85_11455 [Chloroflexi bacterium 13_1_40CM_4_68_4]